MPQAIVLIATAVASTATTVAGATALYYGTSALLYVGLTLGASLLQSLLTPRPDTPKPSDVKNTIREPIAPRIRTYGRSMVGGSLVFEEFRDGHLHKVIALGTDRINAFVDFYVDDRKVTLDAGGLVTSDTGEDELKKSQRCRIQSRIGTDDQAAYAPLTAAFPGVWTAAHKGNGLPHALLVMKQPKQEDYSKVWPNGRNTSLRAVIEGAIVHDPRTDTNVYSENAALCIRDHLVSRWGMRIDEQWVEAADAYWSGAANDCDDAIPLKAGGTEPRWRIGLTYTMAQRPIDVLQSMLDACDGVILPTPDGIALSVGKWVEPTVWLDESMITEIVDLTEGADAIDAANVITATYTSRDHLFEETDADRWTDEADIALRGETVQPVSLIASPSHGQTRRLMKLAAARLNPSLRLGVSVNLRGLARIFGKRRIGIRIADYEIDRTFEIEDAVALKMGSDGLTIVGGACQVIAFDASAYAWDAASEEGDAPPVPEEIADVVTMPVPAGFAAVAVTRSVQGQTLTFAKLSATAPAREDYYLLFEVSADAGATWIELQHARDAMSAEYGPLADTIAYQARATTINSGRTRKSAPTSVVTVSAVSTPPLTPLAFSATPAGAVASLSARADDDVNTRRLQFRRGTTSQAFTAATIISRQLANANDTRPLEDAPGYGQWRYWATAENASGVLAVTPAGPVDVTTLGPDIIRNGNFATDTIWVKNAWTIGAGVASHAVGAATSNLTQTLSPVPTTGHVYTLTYTVTVTAGGVTPYLYGGTSVAGAYRTVTGTYSETLTVTAGNTSLGFLANSSSGVSITNVKMQRTG